MYYIYPKLSEKDGILFRLGGAGLGNILFTYARAVIYVQNHEDAEMIWPTWFSFKLGPILRHEPDKRFYNDLFINRSGYIDGFKKANILITKKHIKEQDISKEQGLDGCVVDFEGFENCFQEIMNDSQAVYKDLVRNLNPKYQDAVRFNGKNSICIHVRLGDFARVSWEEVKTAETVYLWKKERASVHRHSTRPSLLTQASSSMLPSVFLEIAPSLQTAIRRIPFMKEWIRN